MKRPLLPLCEICHKEVKIIAHPTCRIAYEIGYRRALDERNQAMKTIVPKTNEDKKEDEQPKNPATE